MSSSSGGHELPIGIDGVVIDGEATAERVDASLAEALEIRARTVLDRGNDQRWIFRSFDADSLTFLRARIEPNPERGRRPWGALRVHRVYRIPRDARSEAALGVAETIRSYETGIRGVRCGMTLSETRALLGEPGETVELGPVGAFDLIYDDLTIRFLENRVASLQATG